MTPKTPQTAKVLELVKQGMPPKKIAEFVPGMPPNQIRKVISRARKAGEIDFYFRADGGRKVFPRAGSDEEVARNYFAKRSVKLGRVIQSVKCLDRPTMHWVQETVKEEGYESIGDFLRDLVIQAYDDRFQKRGEK